MKCTPNLPPCGCNHCIPNLSSVKLFFIALLVVFNTSAKAQYFIPGPKLWNNYLPEFYCGGCSYYQQGILGLDWSGGISFGPDSSLYILSNLNPRIYAVNPDDATSTLLFAALEPLPIMDGLVAMGAGIFYSIPRQDQPEDSLYQWDINAGTVSAVGLLPYPVYGELWLLNGMLHYISWQPGDAMRKIIRLDPGNVNGAEVVVEFRAQYPIYSLTATPYSSVVVGIDKGSFGGEHMVRVSLGDGTVTDICKIPKAVGHSIRILGSMYEHAQLTVANFIDLDCNDSSLATDSDYNSKWIDCLTEGGVPVTDHDIKTIIESPIAVMTITVANPEDGDQEIFFSVGNTPKIQVEGDGTPVLTLINEGSARIADFEAALKLVRYDDTALLPTPGMRTIHVRFETMEGNNSNIGSAFIEVRHRYQNQIDMGPDLEMCEGGSVTIDANLQFVNYEWSNGESTQTITVTEPGIYSVTVSSSLKCPNEDEIEVVEIPVIEVRLVGDEGICREEEATLAIETNAPFPIDVEILVNGGNSIWLYGIEDIYTFSDWPYNITEYSINEVIPSTSACIEVWDDYQIIEVFQASTQAVSLPICDGDSVLIGQNWIHAAGSYPIHMQSIHGCDSLVTYHVSFNPSILRSVESFTCDATAAGTFLTTLVNPAGCDTILTHHIILTPPDTSFAQLITCAQSNAGVYQTVLQNQAGCDSVVISTVTWEPPVDSTYRAVITCDVSQHGTFIQMLSGVGGCDSVVVTQVQDGIPMVTNLAMTSCDPAQVGVFEQHFLTANQCDSAVITTVTYADQTTVFFTGTTCDPSAAGVFVETLTAASGCDSIVTTTITLLPVSESFILSTTCDVQQAGTFTYTLSNQYGCDSVVYETITLLPSHQIEVFSTTCNASEAGTFVNELFNQQGCDSIVTQFVSYVAVDTQRIAYNTCDSALVQLTETMYTSQAGCDSLVIEETTLFPLPTVAVDLMTDYNGFAVSCYAMSDGMITADVVGVGPWTFTWSTGDAEQSLQNIGEGIYEVTVVDANGCRTNSTIELIAPEPLSMETDVRQPDCVETQFGEIVASSVGGVLPVQYSIDALPFQQAAQFSGLTNGPHTIEVMDANGCLVSHAFAVQSLTGIEVELGEDQFILLGEPVNLQAALTVPEDSIATIEWIGLPSHLCATCLSQQFIPATDMIVMVIITDKFGCVASDEMRIEVRAPDSEVFFPNVFSPNGDGINDRWTISTGADIKTIESLSIYDRWGNHVFSATQFPSNDPAYGWDGTFGDKALNQAVFVYKALVRKQEGIATLYCGDITLIR